jgi:hypothetical protein
MARRGERQSARRVDMWKLTPVAQEHSGIVSNLKPAGKIPANNGASYAPYDKWLEAETET